MITFRQFLSEGGWSNTITQGVKLTPKVAKAAVGVLPHFERDFNDFLEKKGLPHISFGKPVGSSAYIERDLEKNPDKEYGDIDVIFNIPRLDGMPESKINSTYSNAVKEFVAQANHPYLYKDDKNSGGNIIVKAGADWVQVDLVKSFVDLTDWTQHRMTPEHGVKGALMGYMYSALAEVLKLSIGSVGVQAKEKDGEMVPFKVLKVDRVHTLTTDIGKFALDIATKLGERDKVEGFRVSPMLKSHPGMKREHIQIKDLAQSIKGIGQTFKLNNMFGKGALKHISSYDDFIGQIRDVYLKKTEEAASASKFNKAETEDAIRRANETKQLLLNKSKEIAQYLD